ncbi:SEC-C motif-containing protein [Alteromonadaceae bacterium 2753L.S.0a.02]|nr:SEC-C motif-containing protein [Alteromonadaceae bacterium 2753L.S.0a.02]
MTEQVPCPCGSGGCYDACCKPYHDAITTPQSPEQLMRSRYTAFCLGKVDYLIETLHPAFRSPHDRAQIENAQHDHRWLALQVLKAPKSEGNAGKVEFVAFVQAHGRPEVEQLHEDSEFVLENERWYYTEGEPLPPIKLGRNNPCWCGSGKKLKKCHQGMAI